MTETAASGRRSPLRLGGSTGADWLLAGLVLAVGAFLIGRGLRLPLPLDVGHLGPQWFPIAVGALLLPLAAALVVQAVRRPVGDATGEAPATDRRALGLVVASLAAHLLGLWLLGWIPAGAVLFWGVSRALGSRRPLFDAGVAVVFSCTVQVAFSTGLGIALPVGMLLEVR
ncbi:tripartite tricarboxylate transporter TctB family protein [Saccharopolyspora cebuensis]|uniref:Tripartite tricarboxylate transporter TctB family protein n=1 Tax=Saccharopolyspora cebuensis TaxID=418759 RepID=A0ABV4CAE4_9PSEU